MNQSKIISLCFMCLFFYTSNVSWAQTGLFVDGTTLSFSENNVVRVEGAFILKNNTTLNMHENSLLEVNGDWTNTMNTNKTINGLVAIRGANRKINDGFTSFRDLDISEATGTTTLLNDLKITSDGFFFILDAILDLNQHTLFLNNPTLGSLTWANGYIISEKETSLIQQSFDGAFLGDIYEFPFGDGIASYFPITIELDGLGSNDGSVSVWSYRTDMTANPNNRPLPTGVAHLDGAGGENAAAVLDRYWGIELDGYVTLPDINVNFSYDDFEWNTSSGSTNLITEPNLQAQLWELGGSATQWKTPIGSVNTATNQVAVPSANSSTGAGVWTLVDNSSPLLPVDLVFFKGNRLNKELVLLSWQTTFEKNSDHFEIERKLDNEKDFQKVGTVLSFGGITEEINYQFKDTNAFKGLSYYRLKQVDNDGRFEFSDVIAIQGKAFDFEYKIYPNPASQLVHFDLKSVAPYQYQLYDQLGRYIQKGAIHGKTAIPVGHLPKGKYFLQVLTMDNHLITIESIAVQ